MSSRRKSRNLPAIALSSEDGRGLKDSPRRSGKTEVGEGTGAGTYAAVGGGRGSRAAGGDGEEDGRWREGEKLARGEEGGEAAGRAAAGTGTGVGAGAGTGAGEATRPLRLFAGRPSSSSG